MAKSYWLVALLALVLAVACTSAPTDSTPNLDATVEAQVVATLTAAQDAESTIDAKVAATLAAVPTIAPPTAQPVAVAPAMMLPTDTPAPTLAAQSAAPIATPAPTATVSLPSPGSSATNSQAGSGVRSSSAPMPTATPLPTPAPEPTATPKFVSAPTPVPTQPSDGSDTWFVWNSEDYEFVPADVDNSGWCWIVVTPDEWRTGRIETEWVAMWTVRDECSHTPDILLQGRYVFNDVAGSTEAIIECYESGRIDFVVAPIVPEGYLLDLTIDYTGEYGDTQTFGARVDLVDDAEFPMYDNINTVYSWDNMAWMLYRETPDGRYKYEGLQLSAVPHGVSWHSGDLGRRLPVDANPALRQLVQAVKETDQFEIVFPVWRRLASDVWRPGYEDGVHHLIITFQVDPAQVRQHC